MVYATDRSKSVVRVRCLAMWSLLRGISYADVTIFLHATLGGLSSTAAFFSAPIS